MTQTIVLATSSPYKRRLFNRLGVDFNAADPQIDESRRKGEAPENLARRLAVEKARAVHREHPDAWIIGSDQVAALGDVVFEKPGSIEGAVVQLKQLQGKTHRLISAVALATPNREVETAKAVCEMVMRPLTDEQIRRYVRRDRPIDCAGAYKIEEAGVKLFEATHCDDPTAIEGLPLTKVWGLLLKAESVSLVDK